MDDGSVSCVGCEMSAMNDELKQLIEDAAKLLDLEKVNHCYDFDDDGESAFKWLCLIGRGRDGATIRFNPLDPERGDLMKVAEAAELLVDFKRQLVQEIDYDIWDIRIEEHFTKGDYQSLALAVLRAASAVLKARGE